MIAVFTNEDEIIIVVGLNEDSTLIDLDGSLFKNGRDINSFVRRNVDVDRGETVQITTKASLTAIHTIKLS